MVTPTTKDRFSFMPQTAEKEKAPTEDRQVVYEKSQVILEAIAHLGAHEFNEILTKGLKSMTTKQFILILRYFLKPICGNVALDGTNYIDIVFNFLQKADYPYQNLTKSTLKTPTAPHCLNAVIFFLAWLAEYSIPPESTFEYVENSFLPSVDFTREFMTKTGISFQLWNNQEHGAENIYEEIAESYIHLRTEGSTDIEADVLRLKGHIEELKRQVRPESLQGIYLAKRNESNELNQRIEALVETINNMTMKNKSSKLELDKLQQKISNLRKEVGEIRAQIAKQGMNANDRIQALKEISQSRVLLQNEKEQTQNLLEEANEKEIIIANLIQKKAKLIGAINNYMYQFASDLVSVNMADVNFDPSKLQIHDNENTTDFNIKLFNISEALEAMKTKFENNLKNLNSMRMDLIEQKQQLHSEYVIKLAENTKQKEFFQNIDQEIAKIEQKTVIVVETGMQKQHENSILIRQLTDEITQERNFIEKCNEVNEQLHQHKENFKKVSLEKIKYLYEKRKADVQKYDEMLKEKKKFIQEFNRIQVKIPDNVQKVIDKLQNE
jgi:hypothetical protein